VGRSILSIIFGYLIVVAFVVGGEMALTALFPEAAPQPGELPDSAYLVYNLTSGFFCMVIGGYVTAVMAGRGAMKHAIGLATISIAMSMVSMVKYGQEQPIWYSVALMFMALPSALLGGFLRARQMQDPAPQLATSCQTTFVPRATGGARSFR